MLFKGCRAAPIGLLVVEEVKEISTLSVAPQESPGRLLALDLGAKRIGVAVSDDLRMTARPLPFIERRSWKDLVHRVMALVESYEAQAVIVGLPLSLDGSEGSAAEGVRAEVEKFRLSLSVPVYLQDERLTSVAATEELTATGLDETEIKREVDGESAAIILRDFIGSIPNS